MDVKVDEFHTVMAVNVRAPLLLEGAIAPRMTERGDGAIVNVTTIVANRGIPGCSLYGSSKTALQILTSQTSLTSPRSGSSLARTVTSTPSVSPTWRAMTGPAAFRTAARMRW
ncbi:SDR family NAD(P)-dependent oxidoreductase [Streptomyces sp. NPDC001480]|uniref:SDR family NAD(P)-dependent oxidoreductase n=1 Tax=Streptomyces sp. NPDC001480 TaxID=3364577 RepID=UPI0036ADF145